MGARFQILSDLHADVVRIAPPRLAPKVDVVVVAGDVAAGVDRGFSYLRRHLGPDVPILAVAGNHEFYGGAVDERLAEARAAAPRHGITFLEDEVATVAGVRFAGTTLWTDYAIYGDERTAMRVASAFLNDHSAIRGFPPSAARARHHAARAFLARTRCDVVVSHHLPSHRSVSARFSGDSLTPAFASDLDDLVMAVAPELWIHGHTHASCDYRLGATRVLCNPHGYGGENPAYDPALVLDLGA